MAEQRKTKKSEPTDWLQEALALAKYFDFYGELFDEHQRAIFEDYICNDMSLAEIAEREDMTRQGVSDLVKRISRKLHEYEACLHLAAKAERAEVILNQLKERVSAMPCENTERVAFERLCEQLKETV